MQRNKLALVTGSCGLIGSESVRFLVSKGFLVVGIDNNMRRFFFGEEGSTDWLKKQLTQLYPKQYIHETIDIRDEQKIENLFKKYPFNLIIHTAAQPSHDWAGKHPLIDFSINAYGTMILLEKYRLYCPKAVFLFTSSSKVYGNTPNILPLVEQEKRYDLPQKHRYYNGIDEQMTIDNSLHSIYGASKVAADIMVQEYGKYFNLNTGVFRGNCMTGSDHSGTMLHGFLSYLVMCVRDGKKYTIFGYQGKQVRDNIHAYDFVNALYLYYKNPQKGEVYNLGGSRELSVSILEAIELTEKICGKKAFYEIRNNPRRGDHIWFISNNDKFIKNYPNWKISYSIDMIIRDIVNKAKIN